MKKYGIKYRVTCPYHPQVNGQIKSTNKVLENILTKVVANHRRNWAKNLPKALWAYRTTWKNITRFFTIRACLWEIPVVSSGIQN